MLTKSELNATYKLLKGLGFSNHDALNKLLIKVFVGKNFWHYFGARVCYFKENDIKKLIEETENKSFDFSNYSGVNFILNLIGKGHTTVVGTTYTYFLIPDELLDKNLLLQIAKLPQGAASVSEIIPEEIHLLIISDRLFGELLFTDKELLKTFKNTIESLSNEENDADFGNHNSFIYLDNNGDNFYYLYDLFTLTLHMKKNRVKSFSKFIDLIDELDNSDGFTYMKTRDPKMFMKYYFGSNDNYNDHNDKTAILNSPQYYEYFKLPEVYVLGEKFVRLSPEFEYVYFVLNPVFIHHKFLIDNEGAALDVLDFDVINKIVSNKNSYGEFISRKNYFFYVEATERITTHQNVRHKTLNFLQKSNRYVKVTEKEFLIPGEYIRKVKDLDMEKFVNYVDELSAYLKTAVQYYNSDIKNLKIKKEHARFRLPQYQRSNIVISGLKRYIDHFVSERTNPAAQEEIRIVAEQMKILLSQYPIKV